MSAQAVLVRPEPPALEPLLAPISEARPGGEWLRDDPVFAQLRTLREEEDASLPMGVWQRELKRADWEGVERVAMQTLATRTKDLQVAVWLTEAWIHRYGFAGLGQGLRLIAALCRRFWDGLHPPLEEEGSVEGRLLPLVWMTKKLAFPLKSVPVTSPPPEDGKRYAWTDWETGLYLLKVAAVSRDEAESAEAGGMVSQAKFLNSASMTPARWFSTLAEDVAGALAALDDVEQLLIERCGEAPVPSLTPLRDPLVAIEAFAAGVIAERKEKGEVQMAESDSPAPAPSASLPPAEGPITSRAEAYQRLREAADYLLRTEPHSPVPYLVRRAISWGNMSLAELLEELLHSHSDLPTVETLLGIRRPGND